MRYFIAVLFFSLLSFPIFSQVSELVLLSEDTYIEVRDGESGLHLFVNKKGDIQSILLTDSTEDPEKERSVFALRDFDVNETVKDEERILNGTMLDKGYNFLIDSTSETNEFFGEAFHIYIPRGVTFGYPWSREGQIDMGEGSWFNIRTFPLEFGNYDEGFQDNPFVIRLFEEEVIEEEDAPLVGKDILKEIARETNGDYSEEVNGDGAVDKIVDILGKYKGMDVDLVLVIDTTVSMKQDVEFVKKRFIPIVKEKISDFKSVRIGLVIYRDYKEAYVTRTYDFIRNFDTVQAILDSLEFKGGRDIPEAVFEGLYDAQTKLDWGDVSKDENYARIIVQLGDAPPHSEPRGVVTSDMVYAMSKDKSIAIYTIMLEDEKRTLENNKEKEEK